MGVTDGRIVALGSADELAGLRSSKTSVVDSGDGTIIPGLIEPHMHLWSTGLFYDWEDCSHSSTNWRDVRPYARRLPDEPEAQVNHERIWSNAHKEIVPAHAV